MQEQDCDGWHAWVVYSTIVETPREHLDGGLGLLVLRESNVDVANHVVGQVFADGNVLDLAALAHFFENVFDEALKVLRLKVGLAVRPRRRHLVQMRHENRLRKQRFVVRASAAIAVAACAHFAAIGEMEWMGGWVENTT